MEGSGRSGNNSFNHSSLANPQGERHPLVLNHTLQLIAWTVSGVDLKQKEFQRNLPTLSQQPEEKVQSLITTRPGISGGIAGVVKNKSVSMCYKLCFRISSRIVSQRLRI